MDLFLGYLLIFFARIVDVSMATVRTLMVVQGRKVQAALIGFFEVIVYVIALGKVVSGLSNPGNLLAYALGFACGNFVGISIEEKIALGNLSAQVITSSDKNEKLVNELRDNGFGVTVLKGYGKEGTRDILNITLKRKDLTGLRQILNQYDENAFITVSSTKPISGGYFSTIKKK
ncbi:DUF2179 domain-containing protein [Anaerosalibacter sp. Marseille-P3206]|uniref:DUF2179 domain-containing protein n=1 Tax=Anaerosalibacter sp. Marseille-P3206 TaxID=1871005 RepID=UPI000985D975|nr:DUF2179 domain-containing protein [Anaerosalibacter sp. Marseille-P3206]